MNLPKATINITAQTCQRGCNTEILLTSCTKPGCDIHQLKKIHIQCKVPRSPFCYNPFLDMFLLLSMTDLKSVMVKPTKEDKKLTGLQCQMFSLKIPEYFKFLLNSHRLKFSRKGKLSIFKAFSDPPMESCRPIKAASNTYNL